MTLIEVVVALAILGGAAASLVVAHQRLRDQQARAARMAAACAAADHWLAAIREAGVPLPVGSDGVLPDADGLRWSPELVSADPMPPFEVEQLCVRIYPPGKSERALLELDWFQSTKAAAGAKGDGVGAKPQAASADEEAR